MNQIESHLNLQSITPDKGGSLYLGIWLQMFHESCKRPIIGPANSTFINNSQSSRIKLRASSDLVYRINHKHCCCHLVLLPILHISAPMLLPNHKFKWYHG
jgi:hypothetical protein